jgi:hypothetical protein
METHFTCISNTWASRESPHIDNHYKLSRYSHASFVVRMRRTFSLILTSLVYNIRCPFSNLRLFRTALLHIFHFSAPFHVLFTK